MARGKYKQRKHNQDAAQLATDLAQVRAQLDEELARLATARERAELMPDCALSRALRSRRGMRVRAAAAAHRCRPDAIRGVAPARRGDAGVGPSLVSDRGLGLGRFGPESFYAILSGNRAYLTEGGLRIWSTVQTEAIQRARASVRTPRWTSTAEQKMALAKSVAYLDGHGAARRCDRCRRPGVDAYMDDPRRTPPR